MAASRQNYCLKGKEDALDSIELKESLTVECVCPKCWSDHRMKMLLHGRG